MGKSENWKLWKQRQWKLWKQRQAMKQLKKGPTATRSRVTRASKLLDEDLTIVRNTIEKQEPKQVSQLDSMTIKTLPNEVLIQLIADRQGELKQLKIELVARII